MSANATIVLELRNDVDKLYRALRQSAAAPDPYALKSTVSHQTCIRMRARSLMEPLESPHELISRSMPFLAYISDFLASFAPRWRARLSNEPRARTGCQSGPVSIERRARFLERRSPTKRCEI